MSDPLLWPYPESREKNELIMIGLRHPIIDARIQAQRPRPGLSIGLLRLIIFLFGMELIVGAAVFWWWS